MDILKYERTSPVAPIQLEIVGSDMHYYYYRDGDVDRSIKPLKEVPETFNSVYGSIKEFDLDVYIDDSHEFATFGVEWDDPDFDNKIRPSIMKMLDVINTDKK